MAGGQCVLDVAIGKPGVLAVAQETHRGNEHLRDQHW